MRRASSRTCTASRRSPRPDRHFPGRNDTFPGPKEVPCDPRKARLRVLSLPPNTPKNYPEQPMIAPAAAAKHLALPWGSHSSSPGSCDTATSAHRPKGALKRGIGSPGTMDCRIHATAYCLATFCRKLRRAAASCDRSSQVAMARRKLRRLVVRGRWLVASCGSSSYVDDGSSQVATARCTCTMSRRRLRQPVVRRRWLVASCDGSSYVDDGPSQVAAARRTWTMARRQLRQLVVRGRRLVVCGRRLVVRGRWPVASCGSPSYADDGPSQVAADRRTRMMARRRLRQTVVRGRWLVASCGSSSYAGDGPSQVAAARRTWTMARRKLRQPVVRGRWLVAGCGSSSSRETDCIGADG